MCIDRKKTVKNRRKWIEGKKDSIIAYKVVIKHEVSAVDTFNQDGPTGQYGPTSVFTYSRFSTEKMNRINGSRQPIEFDFWVRASGCVETTSYRPYFHLFMTKKGATEWKGFFCNSVILKCEVPKKYVTEVAKQRSYGVIVTKAFKIIEEVK